MPSSSSSRSSSSAFQSQLTRRFGENSIANFTEVTEDSMITAIVPDDNFGMSGQLYINWGKGHPEENKFLIKFDISALNSIIGLESDIVSATLYLYLSNFNPIPGKDSWINIFRLNEEWGEATKTGSNATDGEVSWNSAKRFSIDWETPGGSGNNDRIIQKITQKVITSSDKGTWITIDVTEETKIFFQTSSSTGYILEYDGASPSGAQIAFDSSENDELDKRPYLEVIVNASSSSSFSSSLSSSSSSSSLSSSSSSSSNSSSSSRSSSSSSLSSSLSSSSSRSSSSSSSSQSSSSLSSSSSSSIAAEVRITDDGEIRITDDGQYRIL